MRKILCLIGVTLAAGSLAACQTTVVPIMPKGEQAQIIDVQVTKANEKMGTANLSEEIRVKTLNKLYKHSESGPEKTLKVHVTGFRSPNAAAAFLIQGGGSSAIAADITVIDNETQKSFETKKVSAQIYRYSGGLLGAIATASVNPITDERALVDMLSDNILTQIYGNEAISASRGRTASKNAKANYPVSYQALKEEYKCRVILETNQQERENAESSNNEPILETVPNYCGKYATPTS